MKTFISVTDMLVSGFAVAVVIIVLVKNTGGEGYSLYGGAGDDTLIGDAGDNRVWGGAGADTLDGSDGLDVLDYRGSDAGVTVNLADNATAGGHAEGDRIANFEHVRGSAFDDVLTGDGGNNNLIGDAGDDNLDGGSGNDRLRGGAGSDNLWGRGGNDSLTGDAGADTLDGGAGRDTLDYRRSDAGVTVNLADNAVAGGHAEGDRIANFERVWGSAFDDVFTGDGNDNHFRGNAGADTLDGGAGNDALDYRGSDAGVTVNLADNATAGGHAEGDRIANFEHVQGSAFGDILTGDGGKNDLIGNAGDDNLDGGSGNDRLRGGDGSDNLWGRGGNDSLTGGAGADTLAGGAGNDSLQGGDGSDTFVFRAGEDGVDIITDFTNGEDRIDLSDFSGLSFSDLVKSGDPDSSAIDLTGRGGGRIKLRGLDVADLDPSDFLF